MKMLKKNILKGIVHLFAFVGAVAIVKPLCMGWFYQPEIPEELRK